MSEVRTEPVAARFVANWDEFFDGDMRTRAPGLLYIPAEDESRPDDEKDHGRWYYSCPCGCGASGAVRVAQGVKPPSPSWLWNGSREAPTLTRSVHYVGHWHGFLTDGVWRSC